MLYLLFSFCLRSSAEHLRQVVDAPPGDQDGRGGGLRDSKHGAAAVMLADGAGGPLTTADTTSSGSKFAKVLHVIVHAHPHHIDLFKKLEGYPPNANFWGTVYVNPHNVSLFRNRAAVVDCDVEQYSPDHHVDLSYLCVGPFLADFMSGGVLPYMQAPEWENLLRRNRTEVLGAIVHQADFWIGPGFGKDWPLTRAVWHMPFHCTRDREGEWDGTGVERGRQLGEKLNLMSKETGKEMGGKWRTPLACIGTADMYYVSREACETFGALVEKVWLWRASGPQPRWFRSNGTIGFGDIGEWEPPEDARKFGRWTYIRHFFNSNEVAMPHTMKGMIAKVPGLQDISACWEDGSVGIGGYKARQPHLNNKQQPLREGEDLQSFWATNWDAARHQHKPMCCFGSCCDFPKHHEVILEHPCGHRINLEDDLMKDTLLHSWKIYEYDRK